MSTAHLHRKCRESKTIQFALTGVLMLGAVFGGIAGPLVPAAHASVAASGDVATNGASPGWNGGVSPIDSRLAAVALNPQPLPPRRADYRFRTVRGPAEWLAEVSLNPQPLPPRIIR
jgi:hypothetical protein